MVGKTISHYEILEKLGSGGMGVVYKARDTKLDRIVALKFLPANVSRDQDAKQRFIQEAKAASSLDDPHICTIYEIGESDDGQLFIAMAFYDGSTLQELMERRKIKIDDAASIARQMAKGLAVAHEAGIVHRDVKPANVMVTRKGLVKLLDFGVAKLGESSDLTREGSTIGTASYMSPEQARGEQVDARSDIWSIGAVLYEMLTGARPFGGGYEAAVAYSIINEDPPPIAPARPDTPEGLIDVVNKALSKKAQDRYPTAGALAEELGVYSGETIVETAPQPAYKGPVHSEVPSLQKLVVRFAIGGAVALAVVYAAMIGLGLPDWVFPAAVFLTLIGLPITLYGASLEKKRAKMDSAERDGLSGLQKSFDTRKALRGGVLAGAGLVVVIAAYSILRAAGIGPFATIITSGSLEHQDLIIVADFENRTSEPELGRTISEAIRIDFEGSTAIRILDRASTQSALGRMEINPDTVLSAGIALQIAERQGGKAIIEGDISAAGTGYQITSRIVAVTDGSQLASFRQSASDPSDVLSAIDRLSREMRAEIGEPLQSIRSTPPLREVTTPSLKALQLYSEGAELHNKGQNSEAADKFREAVRLDSTFAMAWRKLGVMGARNLTTAERDSAIVRAYRLRGKLSIRERLLIEASYYNKRISGWRDEESIGAYQEVLRRFPNDGVALNNLPQLLAGYGRFEEAEPLYRRAVENSNGTLWRGGYTNTLLALDKVDEARGVLEGTTEIFPDNPAGYSGLARLAFQQDDFAATESLMVEARNAHDRSGRSWLYWGLEDQYALSRGRIAEYEEWVDQRRTHPDGGFADSSRFSSELIWKARQKESQIYDLEAIARLTGDRSEYFQLMDEYFLMLPDLDQDPEWDNHSQVSYLYLQRGDTEQARLWLDKALAVDTEDLWPVILAFREPALATQQLEIEAAAGNLTVDLVKQIEKLREDRRWGVGPLFDVAELYERAGASEEAIRTLEKFIAGHARDGIGSDMGRKALAHFRIANLYEQRGDIDLAITHYGKMIERWKDADAILQPQVAEAQRRMDSLLDLKAREN